MILTSLMVMLIMTYAPYRRCSVWHHYVIRVCLNHTV